MQVIVDEEREMREETRQLSNLTLQGQREVYALEDTISNKSVRSQTSRGTSRRQGEGI